LFNVLIAEDDPIILEGLSHIVDWQAFGLSVIGTAENGRIAMKVLGSRKVDILLTDIRMPEMDGLQLIEWIRKQGLPVKCIVLSGYDDYPYLQRALKLGVENYLIKSINENELTETLEAVVDKLERLQEDCDVTSEDILRCNVLQRWMLGRIGWNELMDRTDFLGLSRSMRVFQVTILRPLTPSPQVSLIAKHLTTQWLNSCTRTFPQIFCDTDNDVVIINAAPETPPNIKTKELQKELAKNTGVGWFGTRGQVQAGYKQASCSYQQAKRMLGYSLLCPEVSFVAYENAPAFMQSGPAVNLGQLQDALLNLRRDTIDQILYLVFNRQYALTDCPPDYLSAFVTQVAIILMKVSNQQKINLSGIAKTEAVIYDEIRSIRNKATLKAWLSQFIEEFFLQSKLSGNAKSPLVKRLMNYTLDQYEENLSLKLLAAKFNCSSAYLGRLFKEETGETFSSYLNRVRIAEACCLLRSTDEKMNQIAYRVGYASTNYFVNVFKRYTGSYPSRYRIERS
jgi:two-component system, response regulator YesN